MGISRLYEPFNRLCLFDINIWITFSDIFKFLSRSSHFSTRYDVEHATLTKTNTAKRFRNDLNGQ